MSKKKLRPVYMTDEAYNNAQREANIKGLSFSLYMDLLAKKDLECMELSGDPTPDKPVGLIQSSKAWINPIAEKQAMTESIVRWSLGKELNLSEDKIKLIVNKILEETK